MKFRVTVNHMYFNSVSVKYELELNISELVFYIADQFQRDVVEEVINNGNVTFLKGGCEVKINRIYPSNKITKRVD